MSPDQCTELKALAVRVALACLRPDPAAPVTERDAAELAAGALELLRAYADLRADYDAHLEWVAQEHGVGG